MSIILVCTLSTPNREHKLRSCSTFSVTYILLLGLLQILVVLVQTQAELLFILLLNERYKEFPSLYMNMIFDFCILIRMSIILTLTGFYVFPLLRAGFKRQISIAKLQQTLPRNLMMMKCVFISMSPSLS